MRNCFKCCFERRSVSRDEDSPYLGSNDSVENLSMISVTYGLERYVLGTDVLMFVYKRPSIEFLGYIQESLLSAFLLVLKKLGKVQISSFIS